MKMIGALNMTNVGFRSSLCLINNLRNVSTYMYPLSFRVTEILSGEPLKKKKRIDPAVLRAREDRKKRKMEKRVRQLEKISSHMKPIFEIDGIIDQLKEEKRPCCVTKPILEQELETRRLLQKEWTLYKQHEWFEDLKTIKSIMTSQEVALKELKAASKELYRKAVEFDESYVPYSTTGPVHAPPISNYDSPDGEYMETTIRYPGET